MRLEEMALIHHPTDAYMHTLRSSSTWYGAASFSFSYFPLAMCRKIFYTGWLCGQ
jgi:hypothetical protein